MQKLKTFALIILSIIFIISGIIFVLGKTVEYTLLDASFYNNIVKETDISSLLFEEVMNQTAFQSPPKKQASVSQEEEIRQTVKKAAKDTFGEQWMEKTAMVLINDVLSYLKGEQEGLNAVIDLRDKKQALRQNLEKQIDETLQQKAPEEYREQAGTQIESRKDQLTNRLSSQIPDKVVLSEIVAMHPKSAQIRDFASKIRNSYGYFHIYSYVLLMALAALILALGWMLRGIKWVGWSVLISGVFAFIIFSGANYALLPFLDSMEAGPEMEQLKIFTEPFFAKAYTITLYYTLVGFFLILAGILIGKLQKD